MTPASHVRLAVLVALFSVAGPIAAQAEILDGRTFAEANCASCHAVGKEGDSPVADAPPFRVLHQRYPIESLAEAFAEGIVTGHADMPEFALEPEQIDTLLAYPESLSAP